MPGSPIRPLLLVGVTLLTLLALGCCGGGPSSSASPVNDTFQANGSKAANGVIVDVTAKINIDQANATALAVRPGTIVDKTELGLENGVTVYDIHIIGTDNNKYDVKVDANTGIVLRTYQDTGNTTEGSEIPGA